MGFEINKCCLCIELRTGCLIIGYLNLIFLIIPILLSIVALTVIGGAISQDAKVQTSRGPAMAMVGVMLVFLILFLALTIVLLVGLHQYKRSHVKAYLISNWVFIVLSIIRFFAIFATKQVPAGTIIGGLFYLLLSLYFLLVIRSYYLKMDDPANQPAIYNTA